MLGSAFYFVLNMSIAACFVIAVLLLIRLIRPIPRRVIYPLWSIAFLRLILPFSPSSGWSLFNFADGLIKRLVTVDISAQSSWSAVKHGGDLSAMNFIGAAEAYAPVEYKTQPLKDIFSAGAAIWIITAAALLLAGVVLYLLTRTELKKAVRIRGNLYASDMLLSPVLTGIIRPKIIIPLSLDPGSADGRMILAHENIHKRRLDNLWRVLAVAVACAHWFNPLAWIMLKAFFADMEQSCDESVIRGYGEDRRKAYAGALLRFAEEKQFAVSTAFGRSGVKVRIMNVLNYKKLTLIGAAASAVFILAVIIVLATNP